MVYIVWSHFLKQKWGKACVFLFVHIEKYGNAHIKLIKVITFEG